MSIYDIDGFSWGIVENTPDFKNSLIFEFADNKTPYEKYFNVEDDDIVVDIGANIGLFTITCLYRKARFTYSLEPHPKLFKTLQHNIENVQHDVQIKGSKCIKKAISDSDGYFVTKGLFDTSTEETYSVDNLADGISFKSFISQNNIEFIDFLKLDCEGGEYSVFNDDNRDFIFNNIYKIAGEIHLVGDQKEKFKSFRENYLRYFKNFRVESVDGHDIKWWLFDDGFIDYYSRIYIFIDNRQAKDRRIFNINFNIENHKGQKQWWRLTEHPTLEFTTSIPKKGCIVDCAYCPQRVLQARYNDVTHMSLDSFKMIIDKLPNEIRITFSGFVEPWMNKWTTDMLLYAHIKGHRISVFTTGVGMTLEDVERIKDIPFDNGPNGGFCLHLPDNEFIARHPITNTLKDVYKRFAELQNEISGFYLMSMSEVLDSIKDIFPEALIPRFWSRAGNLLGEAIMKPELQKFMDRVNHKQNDNSLLVTCNCTEELYHNVVLPNGDVSLCCMDYDLKHILGNILEQDYEDIIPKPFQCYTLCKSCENGIDISDKKYNF